MIEQRDGYGVFVSKFKEPITLHAFLTYLQTGDAHGFVSLEEVNDSMAVVLRENLVDANKVMGRYSNKVSYNRMWDDYLSVRVALVKRLVKGSEINYVVTLE